MTLAPVDDRPGHAAADEDTVDDTVATDRGLRRFVVAVAAGWTVVTVPYLWVLWVLWTGRVNLARQLSPDDFYDLQGHALLAGHLWVPNGALGIEAFVHGGREYTYFGLFPSLIRLPVLALTHAFDGRLTAPSMLVAWCLTGLFASLLLWRVRVLVRGDAAIGWAEAVASGMTVAALTGGSVLVYLASAPRVSHEDLAWSVALTVGAVFALLGVLERPTWGRVGASGLLVLAASLDRAPTGYACCIGAALIAGWFALPRNRPTSGRWILPMALVAVVPMAVVGLVNWWKLGMPFGLSEADQIWTHINVHRQRYLAASGGSGFGLRFLPSTLTAYLQPGGVHLQAAFPWITLPTSPARTVGNVVLDNTYPTASITASMPLVTLLGAWGLITACRPRPVGRVALTRVLLVAMVAATSGVLLFGYVADRYLADFLPLLALAGSVGLVDLWRRLDGTGRRVRVAVLAVVLVLGGFGIWANVGAALTPSALWTDAQSRQFVSTQLWVSPGATAALVRTGDRLPYFAPAGTIFAMTDCSGVYVSTGFAYATVPQQQLMHQTWDPVVRGPGINHVVRVTFHRPVAAGDPSVTLLTWGKTRVLLVPSGANTVRTVVEHPGGPPGAWPPLSTGLQSVVPGVAFDMEILTDPNLNSVLAGGLGVGVVHYLAGPGPAVVRSTTGDPAADGSGASVTDVTGPPPSMALCRQLLRAADRA
jgi:hypothetical protein